MPRGGPWTSEHVIIMTSNIGSRPARRGSEEGEIPEEVRDRVMADLRGHFRPEFLNRVDDIVLFKPLTLAEIEQIVDLQIDPCAVASRTAVRTRADPGGWRADRPRGL